MSIEKLFGFMLFVPSALIFCQSLVHHTEGKTEVLQGNRPEVNVELTRADV